MAADPNTYLAEERTYLAWIRTGIALMGFGFVVARFGLFVQQLQVLQGAPAGSSYGLSLWFGTALIALGVAVNVLSSVHHVRLVRELKRGGLPPPRPSAQAVAVALLLALIGVAMAIYLVSVRASASSSANASDLNSANAPRGRTAAASLQSIHPQAQQEETAMATALDKGIIDRASHHSVDETVERLKTILQSKGVTLFALVDHSGEAEKAGMKMRPTKLLIFGSPKAGTPLMLAAPSIAIDLPLKILVSEDAGGKVYVSYNSPEYLKERHGLPPELLANIAVVETLAAKAAE